MATAIYEVATETLDLTEIEDMRQKLNILHLKEQEREAREARIEAETASLLAKNMSLDEEFTVEMVLL